MNKHHATIREPLRRVGATEGFWHILGAAVCFTVLARALDHAAALAVPAAAGVLWGGWYGALRAARVRDWFGGWDLISFTFVASYAVALACAALWVLR